MALHDYVTGRRPDLRRAAFLMCGDWTAAGDLARSALASLVAESRRAGVQDPDAFLYAELMDAVRRRPRRHEHVFVAPGAEGGDPARALVVLDALSRLSWRCRAVLVLRHLAGFAVDETADVLGLSDERAAAYEAAGVAALTTLLTLAEHEVAEGPAVVAGLFATALGTEPADDDAGAVAAVFRRADALRRRRLRTAVAAAAAVVVLVAAGGYGLTGAILPETVHPAAAADGPPPPADPVLAVLRPVVNRAGLRIVPREPARGDGWRQYTTLDRRSGRPRGLIELSVHAAPRGLCFPVLADPHACARPERAGVMSYVRYADDRDPDWQVVQVIARRATDGRVLALMATGERGTGSVRAGRPPLTARQAAALAVDPDLLAAFGPRETCAGADPACPLLRVPVGG